jgi:hypothetical protein
MSSIFNDETLSNTEKRRFGFEIDYMLLTCFYNDKPCSSKDFIWRYDYNFGNCFTFNSGYDVLGNKIPILKMSETGSDRSFKLELFLGDDITQGKRRLYISTSHICYFINYFYKVFI